MKKKLMEIENNKLKKCILVLYRYNIRVCCILVSIIVVSLGGCNYFKSKKNKDKQTKLDAFLTMQDSMKIEIDKKQYFELKKMNQQLESQTDTLNSQLFLLTTELRSIKKTLDAIVKKEK